MIMNEEYIEMQVDRKLCMKFPVVLRDKLLSNEIEFPANTEFEYEKLLTYRAVERENEVSKSQKENGSRICL